MLACSACTRRASNAILHRLPTTKNTAHTPSRAIATTSKSRPNHGSARSEIRDDIGIPDRNSNRPKRQPPPAKLQRAIRKELDWISDPWHLAENVTAKLKSGEFDKALALVREASTGHQVIVSWNHLIEHLFNEQRLQAALKLFNEMKKRAQLPNAQTFTIIFTGLAESKHPKVAVGEALKIYNAMISSPRLKPNVKHLNAVLDVCAKAQDIESLFVALRSANTERSPDSLTYTIILNALRHQQSNSPDPNSTLKDEDQALAMAKSIEQTVSRAKLVWEEVMARWRKSEIVMDEELMCAMGRVLLMGGPRETEHILDMVTEILGITRLKDGQPGLMPEEQRKKVEITKNSEQSKEAEEIGNANGAEHSAPGTSNALLNTEPTNTSVRHVPSPRQPIQQPSVVRFAANNTLSLLMRALGNSRLTKLGARYWDYMTTIYAVNPDRRNFRDYLDCLFTGAASGKAARVIASMPAEILEAQAIRRGLLMCYFDNHNTQAFDNANTMFDTMTRKLRYPDPRCMQVYLDVALRAHAKFSDKEKYPTAQNRELGYGMQLFAAIDRIWEPLRLATNHLGFEDGPMSATSPQEKSQRSYNGRRALIEVAQTAQGVCDKMLSQRLLPVKSQEHKITVARRQVFSNCATRWHQLTESPDHARVVRRSKE